MYYNLAPQLPSRLIQTEVGKGLVQVGLEKRFDLEHRREVRADGVPVLLVAIVEDLPLFGGNGPLYRAQPGRTGPSGELLVVGVPLEDAGSHVIGCVHEQVLQVR